MLIYAGCQLVSETMIVRRSTTNVWNFQCVGRGGGIGASDFSLKTTNCIESLLSQLGAYTAKVDRWRTSEQKHRWVASALLIIEPRLHRLKSYRHLHLLREALQREIASSAPRQERVA